MPSVKTKASGEAIFRMSDDGEKIFFLISLEDIDNAFVAHIHYGREGENGPVVVTLFGPLKKAISIEEAMLKGIITRSDLEGPLAGRSLNSLYRLMQREKTYVNVHTIQNPNGEIRGQLYGKN